MRFDRNLYIGLFLRYSIIMKNYFILFLIIGLTMSNISVGLRWLQKGKYERTEITKLRYVTFLIILIPAILLVAIGFIIGKFSHP
ncbi:MAG: hypothetical protein A2Y40_03945 [Candidatus Margulisbacteria bacterium GWF2_35_9]|nr:MAG: hypothetical protein A2Y40_03945 [Candidatus Margulisbacteria bacterium GWF2_35_9]